MLRVQLDQLQLRYDMQTSDKRAQLRELRQELLQACETRDMLQRNNDEQRQRIKHLDGEMALHASSGQQAQTLAHELARLSEEVRHAALCVVLCSPPLSRSCLACYRPFGLGMQ